MLKIVDHAYEPEKVLADNHAKVLAAMKRGEDVLIYHSEGFVHGRLANLPGVRYEVLKALPRRREVALKKLSSETQPCMSVQDKELLSRLMRHQEYRMPYDRDPRGDIFIHWFYRERRVDKLSMCEIFHLNMLRYFNVMDRVECIHIRCAGNGGMTSAMREAVAVLSGGAARVDFRLVPQKASWEHDTFKECVEYAVETGKFVRYLHFKGVTHIHDSNIIGKYRNGGRAGNIAELDILYWCYLLYSGLFNAPDTVKVIGPLHYPGRNTLHYSRGDISPTWALKAAGHYTGSFQAFDGEFLRKRFEGLGATKEAREKELWAGDPYTVEQFLSLCFRPKEVYSIGTVQVSAYHLHAEGYLPEMEARFDSLYVCDPLCRNICVANGTYKYIGGTDTFNWALCKAFIDLGYAVYYYSPDMDGNGATEKHLKEIGALPYKWGIPLAACFANQQSGKEFIEKCPVVQTCHSKWTTLEFPIKGAKAYVSISEEIQDFLKARGYETILMRNGEDLERYSSKSPLREPTPPAALCPRVLSICQGDDSMLKAACKELGWTFKSVPKEVGQRVWHVEDLINDADIVVGIGRSLYDGMACGRACISWDNRKLNPYTGCGYITEENWFACARSNFTGRGLPPINTVQALVAELVKYKPEDGATMRRIAEQELNARTNAKRYLALAGIAISAP